MTSFSLFKYFDAFELDVNVVNFVYYGKTQLYKILKLKYNTVFFLIPWLHCYENGYFLTHFLYWASF